LIFFSILQFIIRIHKNSHVRAIYPLKSQDGFITAGTDQKITKWTNKVAIDLEPRLKMLNIIKSSKKTNKIYLKKIILNNLLKFIVTKKSLEKFKVENSYDFKEFFVLQIIEIEGDISENRLVLSGQSESILVLDNNTGELIKRVKIHLRPSVRTLAQYKNKYNEEIFIISGGDDNLIKIWSLETELILFTFEGHTAIVRKIIQFNEKIISCSDDHSIRVWMEGKEEKNFNIHSSAINTFIQIKIQKDENSFASGDDEGVIKFWNMNGDIFQIINAGNESILSLKQIIGTSGDYNFLVSGSFDSYLKIWDILSGKLINCFCNYSLPIFDICILPNKIHNDSSFVIYSHETLIIQEIKNV
jgi:WD40 repeat protein